MVLSRVVKSESESDGLAAMILGAGGALWDPAQCTYTRQLDRNQSLTRSLSSAACCRVVVHIQRPTFIHAENCPSVSEFRSSKSGLREVSVLEDSDGHKGISSPRRPYRHVTVELAQNALNCKAAGYIYTSPGNHAQRIADTV